MNSNCMYGEAHLGDAVAVRSKRGATLGWLCPAHYKQHEKVLTHNGYHFRTPAELMARGEEHGGQTGETPASESLVADAAEEQQQPINGDPRSDQERFGPPPKLHTGGAVRGGPDDRSQARRAEGRRSDPATDQISQEEKIVATVPSREAPSGARLPSGAGETKSLVTPEWPKWAEGAGYLKLTGTQYSILTKPFGDDEITIRYDGVVYAPWRRYWSRMVEAFAPYVPAIIPVDNPRSQGNEIVVGVVMVCEGVFIGKAWGSHRLEGENDRMSVGDRIESAISDAISKIGKRLNMGEDLWDDSFRDYWKSQYAESYETKKGTRWRRRPIAHVEEHE